MTPSRYRPVPRRLALRSLLALAASAALTACGRKGDVTDLRPPPLPEQKPAPGAGGG